MLAPDEFAAFFQEVHGVEPFPWQRRLATSLVENGTWPDTLDLPTGSGKTAAIDVAVFYLALEASRGHDRRAPVRIAFIVDRRLVVDDAFERARKLARALEQSTAPVTRHVAEQLKILSGDGPPLIARRLRGGLPREDDWARTPSQPTVLCSTVDQIGSRLLFRGYGVSDSMKPVHAGLVGSDCLLLLDEVHLAEPFRQTLRWVQIYRGERWREVDDAAPWNVAFLSATPGMQQENLAFKLGDEDWAHPILQKRLNASKMAHLVISKTQGRATDGDGDEDDASTRRRDVAHRAAIAVAEVREALEHFQKSEHGVETPAICVVLNRVRRARAVFERLKKEFSDRGEVATPILMIGPARTLDREDLVKNLEPIRTALWNDGDVRRLNSALVVVATQCIEAGVDLDFDGLITEAAPIDALRQRFGRLNRAGRAITPYGAVIARKSDLATRYDDPVYGGAIKPAWDYLVSHPDELSDGVPSADFGIAAFQRRMAKIAIPPEALSEKPDAPILLPAHLDLLRQTSPIPAADPDIALYLHGPQRQPDSITVIWRADLLDDEGVDARRILTLVPPRPGEAIELPRWAVRRWLLNGGTESDDGLADVASSESDDESALDRSRARRRVFRWKGDDDRSIWVEPSDIRPGDTILVPSDYGGADEFGWNPGSNPATFVDDRARAASEPFAGRRFAVRVAPGLLGLSVSHDALADALAGAVSDRWQHLRDSLLQLELPEPLRSDLDALASSRRKDTIVAYTDLYGRDEQGRPRGVIFHVPFGITIGRQEEDGRPNSNEDDLAGSLPGFALPLATHHDDVAAKAAAFAETSGLPAARVNDLRLAGRLHDAGKADARFQSWLHYGDPLGPAPAHLLAKSGRRLPRMARESSGLPERWRHEARSVRCALTGQDLTRAEDPELVLWLVGTHHGYGRPLFPHCDPTETAPDVGPQSLAFDWHGLDWPMLFERLKSRYGVWELARMEATLRLADHRASKEREEKERDK